MGKQGREYAWGYKIRFVNESPETVQMVARRWVFVDAHSLALEVRTTLFNSSA